MYYISGMSNFYQKIFSRFGYAAAAVLLLTVFLFSGCANNFTITDERPSDITVEELLQRRDMAVDPSGAYKNADTFFQRQIVSRDTGSFMDSLQKAVIETRFQKPGMFKITTYRYNKPVLEVIFNGEEAVQVDYRNMTSTPITGDELDLLRTTFVFGNAGSDLRSVFNDIEISIVTIDDTEYYKLKCTSKFSDRIPVFEIFVDAQDHLTRLFRTAGSSEMPEYIGVIEDYANYDDVLIPAKYSMVMDRERAISQIVVFSLGVKFDDNEFAFPQVADK